MAPKGSEMEVEREGEETEEEELGFSRNYFLAKEIGSGSNKRSANQKLSDLNLVDEQVLRESILQLAPKHEKETESLLGSYKNLYPTWHFQLRCGFGLLMYGFGSKKNLLEDFASKTLTAYNVIVINGYLPSVNLKQVVSTMYEILQDQKKSKLKNSTRNKISSNSHSVYDILTSIEEILDESECYICLLVHNIDGPALRDPDSQQLLARLSCFPSVYLVASIDHVNSPLLWDKKMVHTEFKWCWHHVPTFAPYKVEGLFYPLILASGGNAQTTKTALVVLQSLTPNAQSVFRILAEYQLANEKEEGMPVSTLYTKCRERFLVSSQVTLNSHLTEFKDHELVKIRKHSDGQDCLHIPLPAQALQKLLQELA